MADSLSDIDVDEEVNTVLWGSSLVRNKLFFRNSISVGGVCRTVSVSWEHVALINASRLGPGGETSKLSSFGMSGDITHVVLLRIAPMIDMELF